MNRPRLTKNIADGLTTVISLAGEDMSADEKRDWGHAKAALDYLENLRAWYRAKQRKPKK